MRAKKFIVAAVALLALTTLSSAADAQLFPNARWNRSRVATRAPASAQPRGAADQALENWNGRWHEVQSDHENYPAWMANSEDKWLSIHSMSNISYATVFKSVTRPGIYYKNGREDWPREVKTINGFGPGGGRAVVQMNESAVMAHAEAWASRNGDQGGYYVVYASAYHPTGGFTESRAVADSRPTRTSVTLGFTAGAKRRRWQEARAAAQSHEIVDVYEVILLREGAISVGQFRDGKWSGNGHGYPSYAGGGSVSYSRNTTSTTRAPTTTRYYVPRTYSYASPRSGSVAGTIRVTVGSQVVTRTIYWE